MRRPQKGARRLKHVQKRFDPIQMIKALNVNKNLKSGNVFTDNLKATSSYFKEVTGQDIEIVKEDHPMRRSLERARCKLDFTACLLERRHMAALRCNPENLVSIHLYPVVAGIDYLISLS